MGMTKAEKAQVEGGEKALVLYKKKCAHLCQDQKDELFKLFNPYLKYVSSFYYGRYKKSYYVELNDFYREVVMAFFVALDKFELERDVKFVTYFSHVAKGACVDFFRIACHAHTGSDVAGRYKGHGGFVSFDKLEHTLVEDQEGLSKLLDSEELSNALKKLSMHDRTLVKVSLAGFSSYEIASLCGLCGSRVSQRLASAIEKIKSGKDYSACRNHIRKIKEPKIKEPKIKDIKVAKEIDKKMICKNEDCKKEFTKEGPNQNQKFCSEKCRRDFFTKQYKKEFGFVRKKAICANAKCKKEFLKRSRVNVYCCRNCKNVVHWHAKYGPRRSAKLKNKNK